VNSSDRHRIRKYNKSFPKFFLINLVISVNDNFYRICGKSVILAVLARAGIWIVNSLVVRVGSCFLKLLFFMCLVIWQIDDENHLLKSIWRKNPYFDYV